MRQSLTIQMNNRAVPQSNRAMIRNLIQPQDNSRNHNFLNKNKIFDLDFVVDDMENPKKYLPNYNQYQPDSTTCMSQFQSCFGQICIFCGSIFSICCMKCCVFQLQTSSAGLIQSFGKFSRLLSPGFNRINPCSQQVRVVDMRIRVLGTGRNEVITKDNVKITIETSVAFRIINPIIAYYRLGHELNRAVVELVISSFRKILGQHVLQDALTDRKIIVNDVIKQIQLNVVPGISIQNVFIDEIILPHDIQNGLSSVARQKRISQATIINSRADVETASLMKQSAQLLDTKAAMQIRYLELVQQLGKRGATLVMDIGVDKKGTISYGQDRNKTNQ